MPVGGLALRRGLRAGGEVEQLAEPRRRTATAASTSPFVTRPRGPLKLFYKLWFDVLIPLAGKILPGGKAYTYLPASVRRFPAPAELAALMGREGFGEVAYRRLGGGIVALHTGSAA